MTQSTPSSSSLQPPASSLFPRGFTLIEMLVSLAITMIMMGAVVSLFALITENVTGSRAIIEMSERLRSARNRLQADLQGATATMTPPLRPENDEGYFELIEGPDRDANYLPPTEANPSRNALGDADDVLMFTVRSSGEPFIGKLDTTTVESQVAEVMYFCVRNGPLIDPAAPTQLCTLYRRVLLVAPSTQAHVEGEPIDGFFTMHDISAHAVPGAPPHMDANTIGDLTKRENRFAHHGGVASPVFPYNVATAFGAYPALINSGLAPLAIDPPRDNRLADDVLLTNVLAFDVQVYDTRAPIYVTGSTALTPTDPGYVAGGTALGAYVDLGTQQYTGGQFNTTLALPRRTVVTGVTPVYLTPTLPVTVAGDTQTYDTWSLHYENNGLPNDDEDGDGDIDAADTPIDEGTDGLDSNSNNIVDDPDEYETSPPYPAPLRGIRVKIRVYEPSSRQVREVTVVQDFLPE